MSKQWTAVITPKRKMFDLNLREVWKYRDLVMLFVRRDFKTRYKQTVLGPLWFVIQPLMASGIHTIVFGNIAGLSTDGAPQFLFYMLGSVVWGLFASGVGATSSTFVGNAHVFGKVYFPRLTTPIANVITQILNFFIQFALYLLLAAVFFWRGETFQITWVAFLTPLLVIQLGLLGMGFGIIISSLTTKYRDLQLFVGFGISLWMYLSPVIYGARSVQNSGFYTAFMLNPVTPSIELFRYGWLGAGSTPWVFWGISWAVTMFVVIIGIVIFNKIEKNFMDTV